GDVRRQADVALLDRLLDRPDDPAIPGLDHDLVGLGHADRRQLVEGGLGAVVVDGESLHERRRRPAGPQPLEVALHRLDRAQHLALGAGQGLAGHAVTPPGCAEIRVPTGSPRATLEMLSGALRSNTMIGRSFSRHSDTAAASRTLSWSRSRSW